MSVNLEVIVTTGKKHFWRGFSSIQEAVDFLVNKHLEMKKPPNSWWTGVHDLRYNDFRKDVRPTEKYESPHYSIELTIPTRNNSSKLYVYNHMNRFTYSVSTESLTPTSSVLSFRNTIDIFTDNAFNVMLKAIFPVQGSDFRYVGIERYAAKPYTVTLQASAVEHINMSEHPKWVKEIYPEHQSVVMKYIPGPRTGISARMDVKALRCTREHAVRRESPLVESYVKVLTGVN